MGQSTSPSSLAPRIALVCGIVASGTFFTATSMALGAVRYAEVNGDGPAATCPQSDPCDLQTAVEGPAVEVDDEIVVLPGDYALGADTLTAAFEIDMHGADGQPRPRLSSTATTAVIARGRIADLEITGSGETVLQTAGGSPLAERVVVHATGGTACLGLGTTNLFRNAVCWSSGTDGIAYSTGGTAPRTATLRNVTAVAAGTGIFSYAFIGGGTTIDAQNVIARGGTADVTAFTDGTGVTSTVTLDNSNYGTETETDANATVTNPGSLANQMGAPLFANAAAGNFHQLAGSPTRNAGSATASVVGGLDVDREPRLQESAPDIGADEYDVLPPDTQITDGPADLTSDPAPTFTFSSDDPFASFMCAIDGGTFAFGACSGPGASPRANQLADGPHTFRVEAVDVSGNADPTPAERGFVVDTKAPETTIDKGPRKKTRKRMATFEFSSDEPSATFECRLDESALAPCSSPVKYKKLKPKQHTFQVRATDAAGNVDATPGEQSWRVRR